MKHNALLVAILEIDSISLFQIINLVVEPCESVPSSPQCKHRNVEKVFMVDKIQNSS